MTTSRGFKGLDGLEGGRNSGGQSAVSYGEFDLWQCRSDTGGCRTEGGIEEDEQELEADDWIEESN